MRASVKHLLETAAPSSAITWQLVKSLKTEEDFKYLFVIFTGKCGVCSFPGVGDTFTKVSLPYKRNAVNAVNIYLSLASAETIAWTSTKVVTIATHLLENVIEAEIIQV